MFCDVPQSLERLTDRQPFDSILLDRSPVFPIGEAEFGTRNVALRFQFSGELVALLVGNRFALLPRLVRAWALMTPGARDRVGQITRCVQILGGPVTSMAVRDGVLVRVDFVGAVGPLQRAVVLRPTFRR